MGSTLADHLDVNVAFATLLTALEAEVDRLGRAGVAAYEQTRADEVQHVLRAAEQAASLRQRLVVLQREWQALADSTARTGRRGRRRNYGRLPAGVPTPRAAYRLPILLALMELDGSARVDELLPRIEQRLQGVLQPIDYLSVASRPSTPRWRNAVHSARLDMLREGLLSADAPRGVWALTPAGRAAAENAEPTGPVLPLEG